MIDHLWQSTIFAFAVWLVTLALRRNRARRAVLGVAYGLAEVSRAVFVSRGIRRACAEGCRCEADSADAWVVTIENDHGPTLDQCASRLSRVLDRAVIDKTGLQGLFDFHVEFSPDQTTPAFLPGGS